jgi:hypothetical protein
MPYYHATWRQHLPSILKHGLGGAEPSARNFPAAEPGVYLTNDPAIAIMMMMEAYALNGTAGNDIGMAPPQALEALCVIVIDDSRIKADLIDIDPNVERRDCTWRYHGAVDIIGMPVLSVDQIMSEFREL